MNKQKNTYTAIKPKDYNDCKARVKDRGWCIKDLKWYLHYIAYYDLYLIYKNNRKKPSLAYTIRHSGFECLYKAGSGSAIDHMQARYNNPELAALLDQLKAQHIKITDDESIEFAEKVNERVEVELEKIGIPKDEHQFWCYQVSGYRREACAIQDQDATEISRLTLQVIPRSVIDECGDPENHRIGEARFSMRTMLEAQLRRAAPDDLVIQVEAPSGIRRRMLRFFDDDPQVFRHGVRAIEVDEGVRPIEATPVAVASLRSVLNVEFLRDFGFGYLHGHPQRSHLYEIREELHSTLSARYFDRGKKYSDEMLFRVIDLINQVLNDREETVND